MRNKSRVEETEKRAVNLQFMSELNKLAGRFIYRGCWEKKKGVIEGFKK